MFDTKIVFVERALGIGSRGAMLIGKNAAGEFVIGLNPGKCDSVVKWAMRGVSCADKARLQKAADETYGKETHALDTTR